jgi:hypothetical protein
MAVLLLKAVRSLSLRLHVAILATALPFEVVLLYIATLSATIPARPMLGMAVPRNNIVSACPTGPSPAIEILGYSLLK